MATNGLFAGDALDYTDPWGVVLPETAQTGLVVYNDDSSDDAIAICLMEGGTRLATAIGDSISAVLAGKDIGSPLSPVARYTVWAQWLADGQTSVSWPDQPTGGIVVAALIVSIPRITYMEVVGGKVQARWQLPEESGGASGATIEIVCRETSEVAATISSLGTAGSAAVALDPSKTYGAYIRARRAARPRVDVKPVPPFAVGPWGPPLQIPSVSPALTSLTYDGRSVSGEWTAPALDGVSSSDLSYVFQVARGGTVVGQVPVSGCRATVPVDFVDGAAATLSARVALQLGPARGPANPVALIAAPPAISSIAVDAAGSSCTVTAQPPTGAPDGASVRVELLADGVVAESAVTDTATSKTTVPLPPGAEYEVRAHCSATLSGVALVGPSSPLVPVARAGVEPLTARYDGSMLDVAWGPPSAAGEVVATVLSGSRVIVQQTGTATGAAIKIALADPPTYEVVLQTSSATTTSLPSAALPLMTSPPSITAAEYDGAMLLLDVTAPAGAAPDAYEVAVLLGGAEVQSATVRPSSGELSLPWRGPLQPGTTYSATVRPRGDRALGPPATTNLILAAPAVTSVAVSEKIAVTVDGAALGDPAAVLEVALLVDGKLTGSVTAAGGKATLDKPGTGAPAVVSRGRNATVTGPWSVPVPVVTEAPAFTAADYDGATLSLSWSGSEAGTYEVAVTTPDATVARTIVRGSSAQLPFAAAPGVTHAASVTSFAGVSRGVSVTMDLVTDAPATSAAAMSGDRSVSITSTQRSGHVQPVVSWDGTSLALPQQGAADPLIVALPAAAPNAATVALRAISGVATGPLGAGVTLLTAAPTGLSVDNDGNVLRATWDPSPDDRVDSYVVTLSVTGDKPSTYSQPTKVPAATLPPPGAGAQSASVTVAAVAGAATGVSSAAVAVFLDSPIVAASSYDGTTLTFTMKPPTTADPDSYDVAILRGDLVLRAATTSQARVAIPLDVGEQTATYSATVRPRAGTSVGPGAPAPPLIVTAPPITSVTVGDVTTVAVDTSAAPDGAEVILVSGGSVTDPVRVDAGSATFATPKTPGAYVRSRSRSATATGPWSKPVPVVSTTPAFTRADYDGATLSLAWSGDESATYEVSVATNATVAQTVVRGLSAELRFAAAPGTAHTASVTCFDGISRGVSVTAALVTDAPGITVATVADDRSVSVTADKVTPQVQPVVSWDGTSVTLAQQAVAQPLVVALPAAAPNGATLALRALNGVATGPAGACAAVLTSPPTGLSVVNDGTETRVTWDPSPDGVVDSYRATLTLTGSKASGSSQIATTPSATFSFPNDAVSASVTVAAVAGATTGVACAPVPVILESVPVATLSFDGSFATATWGNLDGDDVVAYEMALTDGDVVVASVASAGAGATMPAPAAPRSVRVRGLGRDSKGPFGEAAPLPAAAPVITAVAFDAASGDCTVSWKEVAKQTSYEISLLDDGRTVAAETVETGTSYTFPAPSLHATGSYEVSLTSSILNVDLMMTGPAAYAPLLATPPLGVAASFDGAAVRVRWDAVASPLTTGYRVSTVTGGVATALGDVAGTTFEGQFAADAAETYTVVVQALHGSDTGAPSAPVPLFTPAWKPAPPVAVTPDADPEDPVDPQGGPVITTNDPLLVAAEADLAPAPGTLASPTTPTNSTAVLDARLLPVVALDGKAFDVVVDLPDLFGNGGTVPASLPTTGPFVVEAGTAPFPYRLRIAATSAAWTFDDRKPVTDAYAAFLSALEDAGPLPGTVQVVQEAVSRALPQTFAETLYYAYGARFDQGCIDLRPGMTLRAEYESYQNVPGAESAYSSGFIATAVADYEVVSTAAGGWNVGLDGFLARLAAAGLTVTEAAADRGTGKIAGGGGIADAFFGGFAKQHCRLVYPPDFAGNSSSGTAYAYQNAVLIAADRISDLDAATDAVRGAVQIPGSVAFLYLRGRTTFTVLVGITVGERSRLVPVGTTVGNVLAAEAAAPAGPAPAVTGVRLRRADGAALAHSSTPAEVHRVGASRPVLLDWAGNPGDRSWILDLPVLHGDVLDWRT